MMFLIQIIYPLYDAQNLINWVSNGNILSPGIQNMVLFYFYLMNHHLNIYLNHQGISLLFFLYFQYFEINHGRLLATVFYELLLDFYYLVLKL